jgi:hypothetical protein
LDSKKTGQGAAVAVKSLKQIEEQANKTREKMEKLAQVGTKMALLGGAIVAPFVLAMKKYVDTAKETEPISKRLVELGKKWEESQVRLGRVTAEIVLPALEKAMGILDKIIVFAEANPGVVQAALTIGGTLVILGGLIASTAQLVSTVATIQGLAASAGLAIGGGGAAAGGAVAGGALTVASLTALLSTIFTSVVIPALALAVGGQIGLGLGNALAGTNQTWGDILETLRILGELFKYGFSQLIAAIGAGLRSIGEAIGRALLSLWEAIARLFRGPLASGGYASQGLHTLSEKGTEFVMNADTTRNAERAIGGRITQDSAMAYVTNNMQIGSGMTISQTRRMITASRRDMERGLIGVFS